MKFKCTNRSGAGPCVSDSRFNKDLVDGTIGGKIVRKNRFVKFGQEVPWVDFASRKHFEAVDDEARRQNDIDRAWLIVELEKMGVDDIPDNATLSELGATYNKFDPRMAVATCQVIKKPNRTFGKNIGAKAAAPSQVSTELEDVKAWLTEHDVSFQPNTKLAKLKGYKADKEAALAKAAELKE